MVSNVLNLKKKKTIKPETKLKRTRCIIDKFLSIQYTQTKNTNIFFNYFPQIQMRCLLEASVYK